MTADLGLPSAALPADLPAHLSVSQVEQYGNCGERYRLERVERAPQSPSWAMIGGKAVHDAYEDIVRYGLGSTDAEKSFAGHLTMRVDEGLLSEPDVDRWRASGRATKAWPDKENVDWWAVNGSAMCAAFAKVQGTAFLPGVVARDFREHAEPLLEVGFEVQIGENMVRGFIDAVVILPQVGPVPRDYKSGAVPKTAFQLGTYREAMRQLYGFVPRSAEYLMTRSLAGLNSSASVVVPPDLDVYTYDTLARRFDMMGRGRAAGIFLPVVSNMCVACSVRTSCAYGPRSLDPASPDNKEAVKSSSGIKQVRLSYEGPAEVFGNGAVRIGSGGPPYAWIYPDSPVAVEVLPDPIVFADGDVLRFVGDSSTRHRLGGDWYYSDGTKARFGDALYARLVERGSMTQVFP